jgi:hypothetical protein
MSITRVIRTNYPGLRAKRIPLQGGLSVESKTLGTMLSYDMATQNVSRTGMLLTLGRSKKVPFQVNTLIEMLVDGDAELFERPVSCLGKVVRLEKAEDEVEAKYGVHIVQIDARDLDVWEKGVVQLETLALDKAMEQLPAA